MKIMKTRLLSRLKTNRFKNYRFKKISKQINLITIQKTIRTFYKELINKTVCL